MIAVRQVGKECDTLNTTVQISLVCNSQQSPAMRRKGCTTTALPEQPATSKKSCIDIGMVERLHVGPTAGSQILGIYV